jgi:DNA polymerase-3 subunit delta
MAAGLQQLATQLGAEGVKPLYLVQGDERLLVDEAVRLIARHAVDDPGDAMAVTRVDLADAGRGAREILDACRSLGLFTPRTVVIVRTAELLDKRPDDNDRVAEYALDPCRQATLILVATKLNGNGALSRRFKKKGEVLTFAPLQGRDVPRWVSDEARALGHRVEPAAASLIGELVGTGLHQLRLVVDQLSLYVGPGQPITEAAVETVLTSTRAHTIFELVDAVGQRRTAEALAHLSSMFEHREAALKILGMVIRQFRMLWQIGVARYQGASLDDVIRDLRLHPYQAKKMWAQSERFDRSSLQHAYERLYETDLRLKSGSKDDARVMERLVMRLCEGR